MKNQFFMFTIAQYCYHDGFCVLPSLSSLAPCWIAVYLANLKIQLLTNDEEDLILETVGVYDLLSIEFCTCKSKKSCVINFGIFL